MREPTSGSELCQAPLFLVTPYFTVYLLRPGRDTGLFTLPS